MQFFPLARMPSSLFFEPCLKTGDLGLQRRSNVLLDMLDLRLLLQDLLQVLLDARQMPLIFAL